MESLLQGHTKKGLSVHSNKTKVDLSAQETYDQPRMVEETVCSMNHGILGKTFKKESKKLVQHLKDLSSSEALELKEQLAKGDVEVKTPCGTSFTINSTMVQVKSETKKISVKKYLPGVIEPSFGIGRIMYAVLEHAYVVKEKDGEQQGILSLSPFIAPVKCAILPLGNGPEFMDMVSSLERELVSLNLASKVDSSGASIGRKYARADEIGVPFSMVIDFESPKQQDVTIRDRDTTSQIRVQTKEAPGIIQRLCTGRLSWAQALEKYPNFTASSED